MSKRKESQDFQSKHKLDPVTGELQVDYYLDGKLLPTVRIIGKVVEQFAGAWLLEKDLRNSLKWFRKAEALADSVSLAKPNENVRLENREIGDDVKALFIASLVFYAKAFTEAKGRRSQLKDGDLDKEHLSTHSEFMALRHSFAAHSGEEKFENAFATVIMVPTKQGPAVRITTDSMQPDFSGHDSSNKSFESLIEHAYKIATKKRESIHTELVTRAATLGVEYWANKSRSSQPVNIDFLFKKSGRSKH
jgi:hypothetical protein